MDSVWELIAHPSLLFSRTVPKPTVLSGPDVLSSQEGDGVQLPTPVRVLLGSGCPKENLGTTFPLLGFPRQPPLPSLARREDSVDLCFQPMVGGSLACSEALGLGGGGGFHPSTCAILDCEAGPEDNFLMFVTIRHT